MNLVYLHGPNVTLPKSPAMGLYKSREEKSRSLRVRGVVMMEAELALLWSGTKESRQLLEAGKPWSREPVVP